MIIFLFLILHWYLSLFGQTFFLHRYAAHKMFTMNKFWEKFFYIFAWVTQGSSYLNARAYAILHRMHHAYSDTEKDPHTPHFFKDAYHMMLHTRQIYNDVLNKRVVIDEKFDRNFPEYPVIDKIADNWITRIAFGTSYVAVYLAVYFMVPGYHWTVFLLLPVHFFIGPIQGAIVNWAGHKYGYRNFNSVDKSKNTLFWDILLMGELFQNNHHQAGSKPNFAAKWYEFDPTYPIILLLNKLRIIKLVKV